MADVGAVVGVSSLAVPETGSTTNPGQGVIAGGIAVMYNLMYQSALDSQYMYNYINAQLQIANFTQGDAATIQTLIAGNTASATSTVSMNSTVYNDMLKNNISVIDPNGGATKSISDFLGLPANATNAQITAVGVTNVQLTAIENALNSAHNTASNNGTQGNLQMQQILQRYSMITAMINSMQQMIFDLTQAIAKAING